MKSMQGTGTEIWYRVLQGGGQESARQSLLADLTGGGQPLEIPACPPQGADAPPGCPAIRICWSLLPGNLARNK